MKGKKRTERAGEKRSRGNLRRDREETKKHQRDGSENQGRGKKGKHRARQGTREKGVGKSRSLHAHMQLHVHALWWMGLSVMFSPAQVLGAALLTALPLH